MKAKNTAVITVYVPEGDKQMFDAIADDKGVSASSILAKVVRRMVKAENDKESEKLEG